MIISGSGCEMNRSSRLMIMKTPRLSSSSCIASWSGSRGRSTVMTAMVVPSAFRTGVAKVDIRMSPAPSSK